MTEFIDKTTQAGDKKRAEFIKFLPVNGDSREVSNKPSDMKIVELLRRGSDDGYPFDLMAGTSEGGTTVWYLGHWNDGC